MTKAQQIVDIPRTESVGGEGSMTLRDRKRAWMKGWRLRNSEKLKLYSKKHYHENKDQYFRNYRKKKLASIDGRTRRCRICEKEFPVLISGPRYICSPECTERSEAQQRIRSRKKSISTIRGRLMEAIRGTVRDALNRRRRTASRSFWKHVGYTPDELKSHLESMFTERNGFTWENYGKKWHVDHVIPQLRFSFESVQDEGFKQAWALSNLAPMERLQNIAKGNHFIGTFDDNGQLRFIA